MAARLGVGGVLMLVIGVGTAACSSVETRTIAPSPSVAGSATRPNPPGRTPGSSRSSTPAASGPVHREVLLGRSVQGRQITAFQVGDPLSSDRVLLVGCIHGDECSGIAVARDLVDDPPPTGLDLWVIPDLNPDGFVRGSRQNARGVDLNRNFPWRWRAIGGPGDPFYSGPHALSEPESNAAARFILKTHPGISVWLHQHADLVDESGGSTAIERRFAGLVGIPLQRLPRYPGSATGWQNHRFPGTTAFVVELPGGRLSPLQVERFADAVLALT